MKPIDYEAVVAELTRADETCRALLTRLEAEQKAFDWVMAQLPLQDREVVERYVHSRQQLENRLAQLLSVHYTIHRADVFKADNL